MFPLELIVRCLFFTVCGWIGHSVIKALTLGKVDMDFRLEGFWCVREGLTESLRGTL
jgi:hypothetical protein